MKKRIEDVQTGEVEVYQNWRQVIIGEFERLFEHPLARVYE